MVIKNKNLIISFLSICLIVCLNKSLFAQNICGTDIWMGWATNEYDGMSYGAVAHESDDEKLVIKGYGRYQFRKETNLVDFLSYADSDYFKTWIEYGKGSDRLNDEKYGLQRAFSNYYVNNKEEFIKKQDEFMFKNFYDKCETLLNSIGCDIKNNSMYLKGAVYSAIVRKYDKNEISQVVAQSAVRNIKDCYDEDENKFIENIYTLLINMYSESENDKKRFAKEREACLDHADDTFESNVGEILTASGTLNTNFILELNRENKTIFQDFLNQGKFYTDSQLEWYDSVRHSIDFSETANIHSGFLDFSVSSTKGLNMANYADLIEEDAVLKVINNGTGIYYIPQNSKKEYASKKFGSNNVAQGGGSLACLSMAMSKLLNKRENNLITPDKIINKLVETYGDYNKFYDYEKCGQQNEIISEVANMYGLKSQILSAESVIPSLSVGNLVIARVKESEFTKTGNFVLLAKFENINGQPMVVVVDPNIYHARFMYNYYSLDYLKDDCEAIFFEIKM